MHYFFSEGTFLEQRFLYQNENSPDNFCLVPFLIFGLLKQRFLSSLKQKKLKANHAWYINDSPKREHLTDQLISNSATKANLNAKLSVI